MEKYHNSKQLKRIITRYVHGKATPEEIAFLDALDNYLDEHHDTFALLSVQERQAIRTDLLNRLKSQLSVIRAPQPKRLTRWLPYAAAVAVVALVGTWLLFGDQLLNRGPEGAQVDMADIASGGNRASLTLADGTIIDLDGTQSGIIVGDKVTYADGSSVLGKHGSMITGEHDATIGSDGLTGHQIAKLTTPRGGTYQITLPDGSKVWLNAASTLTYPSRFLDDAREVSLVGEAFFEIRPLEIAADRAKSESVHRKSKVPFRVVTAGQTVEVLGTEFNISAYVDEFDTKTTLVSGSVQIVNSQSKIINRLQPGEQSVTRGTSTQIQQVNPEIYTAWKEGYFLFKKTPLEEILRQAARWYDIELEYRNGIPKETFSGDVKRDVSLGGLLEILQLSTIDVTLEGRTLIVR